VTRDGRVYNLARNAANQGEFCGACFAPNHPTLFVNIQKDPGLTLAVTGPWAARGGQGTLAGRG
jgi:secreted PhoX family phosphatase